VEVEESTAGKEREEERKLAFILRIWYNSMYGSSSTHEDNVSQGKSSGCVVAKSSTLREGF
jgi:hypothetical protein